MKVRVATTRENGEGQTRRVSSAVPVTSLPASLRGAFLLVQSPRSAPAGFILVLGRQLGCDDD